MFAAGQGAADRGMRNHLTLVTLFAITLAVQPIQGQTLSAARAAANVLKDNESSIGSVKGDDAVALANQLLDQCKALKSNTTDLGSKLADNGPNDGSNRGMLKRKAVEFGIATDLCTNALLVWREKLGKRDEAQRERDDVAAQVKKVI